MNIQRLRILFFILAVALVLIPSMIVITTDQGFGSTASHLLVSASIASLIAATILGLDRRNKNKFFTKIGVIIGELIVLLSLWL